MVNSNILWYRLKLKDLPERIIRLIQSWNLPCIVIEIGGRGSNRNYLINQGVLQSVHYHPSFLICVWAMLWQKGRKMMVSYKVNCCQHFCLQTIKWP
jgi:hypothetical protein